MTKSARTALGEKLSIEKPLTTQLLKLHKKVFAESLDKNTINLVKYRSDYRRILSNTNRRIALVNDVNLYNELFLEQSINNIFSSLSGFFGKKDINVIDTVNLAIQDDVSQQDLEQLFALLPLKASRDSQVYTQQNYERQNLIQGAKDEKNTEEDIAIAIATNQAIETTKRKRYVAIFDNRTRHNHMQANGQVKKVNQPYIVGGERMMYPADSSLGASPSNYIGCRCYQIFD